MSGRFEIETSASVAAVEADWHALEADGLLTPFQRLGWLRPFYAILAPGQGAKPLFVVVREAQTRAPVMLLPLCLHKRYGLTLITFADLGVSDYNAPVFARSLLNLSAPDWQELWQQVVRALPPADLFHIHKVPAMIGDHPNPMLRALPQLRQMAVSAWSIALPESAAVFDKQLLNQSFAKDLARQVRRVDRRGHIAYGLARGHAARSQAFAILVQQRKRRFEATSRDNILDGDVFRRFYEHVTLTSGDDFVYLGTMTVDGVVVAVLLGLHDGAAVRMMMPTYESEGWANMSLGNLLIQKAIHHAIETGLQTFDLTIGDEPYKRKFGMLPMPLLTHVQPLSLLGTMVSLALDARRDLKTRFNRVLGRQQAMA